MSAGMPELGSKISLISKADIRYEGRLFTVDPKECTIALAAVRSFGTEDRDTPYPVPAQNQTYDYILFRGSDIKDIRVVNNVTQPLNDPAIMQLSVPSMGQQQFQTHPMLGHMGGPQMGQFAAPSAAYGTMAGLSGGLVQGMGSGMTRDPRGGGLNMPGGNKPNDMIIPGTEQSTTTVLSPAVEAQQPNDNHASVLDIIGGGSRSLTPASLGSRKSPTNDQGVQAGGKRDDKKNLKPIQPPRNQHHYQQQNHHQQQQHHHHQQRKSSTSRERRNSRGGGGEQQEHYQRNQNRQQSTSMHRNNQNAHQNNQQQGSNNNQRGGWNNRGPMRPRGRPRGGGFKPNQGQPTQGTNKSKNTLKFENDFDFEQANTEFEELRSQLAKVKIDETNSSTTTTNATSTNTTATTTTTETTTSSASSNNNSNIKTEIVNGDIDKKDDSGNETGAGENEQEEEHEVFYDKTKSFFDKISCEAVERAKGKSQRTDWRTERKLNSETFGVAATRRGNFRGRGGFRGMGYRGNNGGYRGSYRPQQRRDQQTGGRIGQNQQSEQQRSSNVQQQQSQQQPQPTAVPAVTGI